MLRLLLLLFLISSTYGQYQNQYQAQTRAPPRQSQPYHYPNHSYQQQQQPQQSQRVQVVHHTPQNLFSSSTIRPTHPTHNTHYTTHQQQQLAAQQHQQAVQQHQQNVQQQKVKPYTPAPTAPARLGGCNVPPDYWCDSYEIAQRCDVVKQCENFKLDRRPITVTLMYEALCPFCQKFISNHLGNLYNNYQGKIELELVPWGNSRLLSVSENLCFTLTFHLSDYIIFFCKKTFTNLPLLRFHISPYIPSSPLSSLITFWSAYYSHISAL